MFIQKKTKRVMAGEEVMEPNMEGEAVEEVVDGEGEVVVDPAATDLLFEAEDVAELVAEITGEAVEVSVTDDAVEFAIGEDVYTVEAEVLRGKRTVAASTKRQAPAIRKPAAKPVAASTQARASRPVRKVPTRK